jgi:isopenicillin-N epimerase
MVLRRHWGLDPEVTFLNHGSFGACPTAVLAHQAELRDRMERQPVQFFVRDLPDLVDSARERIAEFVDADPEDIALVRNATEGVNAVVGRLSFEPGDEVVVTNHGYRACDNAVLHAVTQAGGRLVFAKFPLTGLTPDMVIDAIEDAVTERTRLALIDHVTSPTGLILPIERIVPLLEARGIPTLVDGAHGPGMLALSMRALEPAWYVGNFHKWTCAPKGSAFLFARKDHREGLHPATISHGYSFSAGGGGRSRYHLEFDWTGTHDPTASLATPFAIDFMASIFDGGWPAIRAHNRNLTLRGREILCERLGIDAPCSEDMIGNLAALSLPDKEGPPPSSPLYVNPLQDALIEQFGIEVPIVPWPDLPKRLVRISGALYNVEADYHRLAEALEQLI